MQTRLVKFTMPTYRLKHGLLWHGNEKPSICISNVLKVACVSILCVLAVLCMALAYHSVDLKTELDHQKQSTLKYTAMVAHLMNGKPLYDRLSDTAFIFEKPVAVKLNVP